MPAREDVPARDSSINGSLRAIQDALQAAQHRTNDDAGAERFLAALTSLRRLRADLGNWEPQLIAAARASGANWADLAPALGVASRQAAERRYLRLQPSPTGETTGEQRVRAERNKRAGDRAVASWARENSAALRQLAGRVSALDNLNASARQHADRLQRALGDDDPATLLSPLTEARPHLAEEHAALAEQLGDLTQRAEQLRRDAVTDRHERTR